MVKYEGWSYYGKPFSAAQFKKSHVGQIMKSYDKYLISYAKQWKNPRLRKQL